MVGPDEIAVEREHRESKQERRERQAETARTNYALGYLIRRMERIMRTLEETLALVEAQSTSVESISTLLAGIKKQLDEALGGALTPSQQMRVDAIFNKAQANKDQLDAAIKANDGVTDDDEKIEMAVEVTSSANPANVGDTIVLSGSVLPTAPRPEGAPAPTGTISFMVDGNEIGSGTLDADGVAVYTVGIPIPAGDHEVFAAYSGDAAYQKGKSEPLTQTITPGTSA